MLVYHYCSMDAFKSIIENKTLRLTDITKSNDSEEVVWVTQYVEEILNREYGRHSTELLRTRYPKSLLKEMMDHFKDGWFNEEHSMYKFYAVCFSEDGDLLSQWRGYSQDATGVAIGFEDCILEEIGSLGYLTFSKVSYDTEQQREVVVRIACDLIRDLHKLVQNDPKDIKYSSMTDFDSFFRRIYKVSPFLKSPFFKEEKECRLVFWGGKEHIPIAGQNIKDGFSLSKLNYETTHGILRSYTDLSFEDYNGSFIKKVRLGPKCKNSIDDIKCFLKSKGFENIEVIPSGGSYR